MSKNTKTVLSATYAFMAIDDREYDRCITEMVDDIADEIANIAIKYGLHVAGSIFPVEMDQFETRNTHGSKA